jgi:CheY-like chemotaxis protein
MSADSARVLVVDDDPDFRGQMRIMLEGAGHEVVEAANVDEAMEALEDGVPDLAVLDLMMDNTDDGFVLAHRIRSRHPDLPIVLVTAVTRETGMEFDLSREGGSWIKADAILAKPIRYEQLARELERLLPDA